MQIQGEIDSLAPNRKYRIRSLLTIPSSEGFKGVYRGYSISLLSIPVFNTIYFPLYELAKQELRATFGWREGDLRLYSAAAGVAGSICNVLTNPFFLLRTRMQAEAFADESSGHYNKKYGHGFLSIFTNMRHIV